MMGMPIIFFILFLIFQCFSYNYANKNNSISNQRLLEEGQETTRF